MARSSDAGDQSHAQQGLVIVALVLKTRLAEGWESTGRLYRNSKTVDVQLPKVVDLGVDQAIKMQMQMQTPLYAEHKL